MIDIEDLLLLIENKQVDLEYSSSFNKNLTRSPLLL